MAAVKIKGVAFSVTCKPRRLWLPKFVYKRVVDDIRVIEFRKDGELFLTLDKGSDLQPTSPKAKSRKAKAQ